jgi:hypothetical protein
MATDPSRELFRHTLATLAYRAAKPLSGAPASFASFAGVGRTPAQVLAHLGDLMDWALSMASGRQKWHDSTPLPWDQEVGRFFTALQLFDDYLASSEPLHAPLDKLFQGPVADALTHVGQLAMMRRLAAAPIVGENYFVAEIAVGRVGSSQNPPKKTF